MTLEATKVTVLCGEMEEFNKNNPFYRKGKERVSALFTLPNGKLNYHSTGLCAEKINGKCPLAYRCSGKIETTGYRRDYHGEIFIGTPK